MAKLTMKNQAGKSAASIELSDDYFGMTPNKAVMHQVVVAQLAHRRAGTQKTKGRAEVSGGGKKPFAEGGVVTEPTLAVVGESGPEIIAPATAQVNAIMKPRYRHEERIAA